MGVAALGCIPAGRANMIASHYPSIPENYTTVVYPVSVQFVVSVLYHNLAR